jgi:hypothetical protein
MKEHDVSPFFAVWNPAVAVKLQVGNRHGGDKTGATADAVPAIKLRCG